MDEFILKVKQELDKCSWDFQRIEVIKNTIKLLRNQGYSDEKIRNLFKIECLKEQDNSHMITNNTRYLELLNDILKK